MALSAGTFQTLANKLMTDTFAAFAKTLTLKQADAVTYGSAQTYTTESGSGILLSKELSQFENQLIQVGDIVVFTNASDWTTDPSLDDVVCTFDGEDYQIINVEKDADNAAYFLTLRPQ